MPLVRFVAQCAGSTGMALPGRRNGRLAGLEKKSFLLILIIPSASCACAGASLIYPKLDYTLLLLPILYCVNRAPPENRMIMRFLPSHFCNPLQTDVNRLQTDAFGVQSDAIGCVCASLRCVPRALGCAADAMENLQEPGRGLRKMQPWKYGLKNSARPNPAEKNTAPMLAAVPRAWGLFVHCL